MTRRAFTMRLKPYALAEYKYHHDNIWPELVAEMERSGIASITTFQHGDELILVSEVEDEDAWDKLWNSEIHQQWIKIMEPLVHVRDDGSVDTTVLTEVFHLTTNGNGRVDVEIETIETVVEPIAEIMAPSEIAAEDSAPASVETPEEPGGGMVSPEPAAPEQAAAEPARPKAPRRKKAAKKPVGKKKSSGKKAKHQAARKPNKRGKKAAKSAKKSTRKKSSGKKAKKAVKKRGKKARK